MEKAIFLGLNPLGDIICTTPILREYRRKYPQRKIIYIVQNAGFCRILENNPDIDLIIYSDRLYIQGMPEDVVSWLQTMPLNLTEPASLYTLNLKYTCTSEEVFKRHLTHAYAGLVNIDVGSIRPTIVVTENERRSTSCFVRRPYVIFSMHSVTNPERADAQGRKKDWRVEYWHQLAAWIHSLGTFDIFAVGAEIDTPIPIENVHQLYGLPIKTVAALLEKASCVVTLENGIAHLSSALDTPTVLIYSDMMALEWANPAESPRTKVFYGDPFDLDVDRVIGAVGEVLASAEPISV